MYMGIVLPTATTNLGSSIMYMPKLPFFLVTETLLVLHLTEHDLSFSAEQDNHNRIVVHTQSNNAWMPRQPHMLTCAPHKRGDKRTTNELLMVP